MPLTTSQNAAARMTLLPPVKRIAAKVPPLDIPDHDTVFVDGHRLPYMTLDQMDGDMDLNFD